jgi:hypothetical protein
VAGFVSGDSVGPGTQSAKIPCTSSYWSLNTPQGAKANYDFTGSYVFAKVTPATGGTGTRETLMEIQGVDSVNNKISFYVSGPTLFARTTSGGANTPVFSATYDPVNHLWLRLREAGGTTFYDTSPDGHTWTNFASTANPAWDIAHISVGFTSGYYGTETAADTFIDNVNFSSVDLVGSAGGVATVTSALAVARTLVGQSSGGPISALLFEPFDSFAAWTTTGSGISIATGRNGTGALSPRAARRCATRSRRYRNRTPSRLGSPSRRQLARGNPDVSHPDSAVRRRCHDP